MVNFLINRPIAVTMTFLSILILGVVSLNYVPISLMPDIAIPEVIVQVHAENMSARDLENTVVKPLRRQLLQTSHLVDIKSETKEDEGTIYLKFDFGTDIDYTFIEVNEKIDRAMSTLPRSINRPRVIKASATDIPVFYLNLTLKNLIPNAQNSKSQASAQGTFTTTEHGTGSQPSGETFNRSLHAETKLIELSRFAENVIRKRIEQLPQVSMVDMSGMVYSELLIMPLDGKLTALGISLRELEMLVRGSNLKLGNLLIRDGQYQYNVQVDSEIKNIHDIESLNLSKEGRIFKLSDLAEVTERPQKRTGLVTMNGQDAISMAIIKQGDVQMNDLKETLNNLVESFKRDYPHIHFEISRDQTQLLSFAIDNLRGSLVSGVLLAFVVMFFFLKDFRSPLLIGISVPVSLIVTLLFFHLVGITINIISLSGLILGVGMMVDNSIIVIDNITQYRERGFTLLESCVKGTEEVFRPLLSSVLTTCAVFIPLIFLSGISGAMFFDQAITVSIGLFVSLTVAVTLLPVYYRCFYKKEKSLWLDRKVRSVNTLNYEGIYERGFRWVMRNQKFSWTIFFSLLALGTVLYYGLPKSKLPEITRTDFILNIDWNERVNVDENRKRTDDLLSNFRESIPHYLCFAGSQQFLLKSEDRSSSETSLYIKASSAAELQRLQANLAKYLDSKHPDAVYAFSSADNIFDVIFSDEEPPLVARLQTRKEFGRESNQHLVTIHEKIQNTTKEPLASIAWQEYVILRADPLKLKLYNLSVEQVVSALESAFNEKEILLITSSQDFVPVILGGRERSVTDVISQTFIANDEGKEFPLRELVVQDRGVDLKKIVAGPGGEYYPINFWENIPSSQVSQYASQNIMASIKSLLSGDEMFRAEFSGNLLKNNALVHELAVVLGISLLLLYFILASQFESLILPFIILLEVPVDIAGAFLFLKIFSSGINLMSMIGIVVMSGIIVNDSILKLDTVIQLRRKEGMSLMRALLVAGQRRLKPILMTSLTTILGLVPVLFSEGLGSDIQKPLALAIIGGMIVGTVVSLYFIPLCYYYLSKDK